MSARTAQFQGTFFLPAASWSALEDRPVPGVATLLHTEMARLDEWQLDEWLRMFAEECVYWVPIVFDAADPSSHVNLIFDNRALLEDRVFRLQTGQVPSQDPPSRTVRSLNGLMTAPTDVSDEILTRGIFSLYEQRPRDTRAYQGRYLHRLRRQGEGWEIVGKKVALLTSDEPLPSLTFLL